VRPAAGSAIRQNPNPTGLDDSFCAVHNELYLCFANSSGLKLRTKFIRMTIDGALPMLIESIDRTRRAGWTNELLVSTGLLGRLTANHHQKRQWKRCRQWCRGASLGPGQFDGICIALHRSALWSAKRDRRNLGRKRKETPRQPRGFLDKRCVLSDYRSGETGIRTLGTRKGTPVFKTGAGLTLLACQTSQ